MRLMLTSLLLLTLSLQGDVTVVVGQKPVVAAGGGPVIDDTETNSVTTGSAAVSFTGVAAGNLLVASTANEDSNTANLTVTGGGLTWTKRADGQAIGSGNAEIWTAVFTAGGSITVTGLSASGVRSSLAVYSISNHDSMAAGFDSDTATGQTQPSVTSTTTREDSLMICISSDFSATSGTPTYRTPPTHTQVHEHFETGRYHAYHYYGQATTTGGYTMGLTAPTHGTAVATAVLEIRKP